MLAETLSTFYIISTVSFQTFTTVVMILALGVVKLAVIELVDGVFATFVVLDDETLRAF